MNNQNLRIVFMGTPEFAVPSLDILVKNNFNVVGVITTPDKRAGRGMQLQESAVKKYATENNLRILQPEKLKSPEFIAELHSLKADLQIVVAFRMLPEVVWQMPALGTFNLHASLLPQYRGAAPINWAIINGEKETGVTTFFLQQEIDTGAILLQEKISISENETAGELHDRMKWIGAELVLKTVQQIEKEEYNYTQQIEIEELNKAPKLFTETCRINWNKSVNEIHNLIRGLSPYPAAFTILNGKMMKVLRSIRTEDQRPKTKDWIPKTGEIISDGKTFLRVQCADGLIDILELQAEGKKRMKTEEFLRGNKIDAGASFQ